MKSKLGQEKERLREEIQRLKDKIADNIGKVEEISINTWDSEKSYLESTLMGMEQAEKLKAEEIEKLINDEKKIVETICLGMTHPPQENQEKFTKWLQRTVIFHLDQIREKAKHGVK